MKQIQICEGCGEEFLAIREFFCTNCSGVRMRQPKAHIPKQVNERNRESKEREKRKRYRKTSHVTI